MRSLIVLFLILLSSQAFSMGSKRPQESAEINANKYYQLLDYDDPAKVAQMVEFDEKLVEFAIKKVQKLTEEDRLHKKDEKEGLMLVYVGMYIINTNNGVLYDKIDIDKLIDVDFMPGDTKLIRRQAYAAKLLEISRKLSPDDARIEAWQSSAVFRREMLENGQPRERTQKWVVDLVKEDPIFHLFNGLVLNNGYPFKTKDMEAMVKQAKIMVSFGSPCIPINPVNWFRGNLSRCRPSKKTPFGLAGVMLLMGDAFLKLADRYLTDDNPFNDEKVEDLMVRARVAYNRAKKDKKDPYKNAWKLGYIVEERRELLKASREQYDSKRVNDYFKSTGGAALYQCNSCHQNGKAKRRVFY